MDLMIRLATSALVLVGLQMVSSAGLAVDPGKAPAATVPKAPIVKTIEVQYAGPATFGQEQIVASMTTSVGKPYSETAVEQDIRGIYKTGRIYNVRIFGQALSDGVKIFVVLQCRPKIAEVRIQGATAAVEGALQKEMNIRKGELLDGVAVASDKQRIIAYYSRSGMGPIDVGISTEIDEKLGSAIVLFSIHDVPEEAPDTPTTPGNTKSDK